MRVKWLGVAVVIAFLPLCGYALEPADRDPALQEAIELGKSGKYPESIAAIKRLLQNPSLAEKKQPHVFLGLMYFKNGQYDDALSEFSYTLTVDRNSPMAYYFLGLTYEAKAVESSDARTVLLLKRKALESWENYVKFSKLKKPTEYHHRNLGVPVQKSRESAEKHIAMLKEALGDEKN